MDYSDLELSIAKRYASNDLTSVQFNYLLFQHKLDRRRVKQLAKQIKYTEPYYLVVKLMVFFMIIHFLFCLLYSLKFNS